MLSCEASPQRLSTAAGCSSSASRWLAGSELERSDRALECLDGERHEEVGVLVTAISIIDFCEAHPADAQLLVSFRREDLLGSTPEGPLADELVDLNRPVERAVVALARRLYGTRSRAAITARSWSSSISRTARRAVTSSPGRRCPGA
jgi:hypothetical protein